MTPQDALQMARERGLDLVEVASNVSPPVCRFLDFNKFRYDEQRREREARRKRHLAKLKEMKFKPHIGTHDYQVKLMRLKKFLSRGDNAKVTMVFRGRELSHAELGRRILDRLVVDLTAVGKVERTPILEGRFMTMVFFPDHEALKRAAAKKAQAAGSRSTEPRASQASSSPSGVSAHTKGSEHAETQNP